MKRITAIILTSALLASCGHPAKRVTATKVTEAYAEVNGYPGKPAFTISIGTVCELGETVYGKVDAYTEIKCSAGHGWVLESENFKPLS
ncbi:hypothetical protein ACPRNU_25400 [Chromobacterium vaccinii]|uniref:hypothetical protein n=1 Tax=Chromobacterium vaccinii TaxID=1108595 RepID=UPI003C758977